MEILSITKSKTRKAILELYFGNPDKKYYLRELGRLLFFPVQNIRREMLALKEFGLFKEEKVGNLKYYFLDKEHPIFTELKNIIFKTIGVEASLRSVLKNISGVRLAFIFGSFAKGKEKVFSDIDLIIVGSPDESELVKEISELERKIGREINYHLFSEKEWRKKKDSDSFIKAVLRGPKINLI